MNYEQALAHFIELLTIRHREYMMKNFPRLEIETFRVDNGRVYDRIVHGHSSYCYVEKKTGNILKGYWNGPTKPKVARGNIFGADPLVGTEIHGTTYLR